MTDMTLTRDYPPATRGRVVVWGLLAHAPFGGMTWQVLHHVAGLRALGFDVWYVEDTDHALLNTSIDTRTLAYEDNVRFLARHMDLIGLADRWAFRPPGQHETVLGSLDAKGLARLYRDADAVFNLCGAHDLLPHHDVIRCLVYLETDPVANQVAVAKGEAWKIEELAAYRFLFTYGTNLGAKDCRVPIVRFDWITTVPPVVVDWWETKVPPTGDAAFTSIVNWSTSGKDVTWGDEVWRWTRQHEFMRFIDAPLRANAPFEVAIRWGDYARTAADGRRLLEDHGWRHRSANELNDPMAYRDYVLNSRGEFTVAKEQYVLPRSGWFSDRTACYLAAGRPAIIQDTGFAASVGWARGAHTFHNLQDATEAVRVVTDDYARESQAAHDIAREVFEATSVLGRLTSHMGLL